jgi:pyridoxamine 5'-phosphate oxidase
MNLDPTDNLAAIRTNYAKSALDEADAGNDPLALFQRWLGEAIAAQVPEPNAMTLATVGSDMRPSTRIVLIKGLDARGIVWFTNYESHKARELAGNPFAALQFHWVELERTVRIEGRVEKVASEESDAYFHSRPLDSRVGAWASPQSRVIAGREVLDQAVAKYNADFGLRVNERGRTEAVDADAPAQPPRPPHWGGYRLVPDRWQFWQGRPNRLHDRLRFELRGEGWQRDRLAP